MKTEIGIFDAKTNLSSLIEQVQKTNEPVLITKHGKPVAQLAPVAQMLTARKFGYAPSPDFYMAPDFDEPLADFAEYMPAFAGEETLRAAEDAPTMPRRRGVR